MAVTPSEFAIAITDLRNRLMFDRIALLENPVGLMKDLEKTVRGLIDTAANLPESLRDEVRFLLEDLRRWLNVDDFAKSYDQSNNKQFDRAVRSGITKIAYVFENKLKALSIKLAVWLPEGPRKTEPSTPYERSPDDWTDWTRPIAARKWFPNITSDSGWTDFANVMRRENLIFNHPISKAKLVKIHRSVFSRCGVQFPAKST